MHQRSGAVAIVVMVASLCLVAAGCGGSGGGGGGGGGGSGGGGTETPRALGGTVTYDRVPTSAAGLDYASVAAKPVRGAVVEALDASNAVVATSQTDEAGRYALTWNGTALVRVRVKAQTVTPPIRVEDNTSGNAIYAAASPQVDAASVSTLPLHAPSGWGGTSYTGPRVAAPFAILDTAYTAARAFMAERTVIFPALAINWSENNRPEDGDKSAGQIGTSHWDGQELYILGKADADTDEFDAMIIAHEWGHYYESKLSRSDSPGGSHGFGQYKDPRLAWGEGWATALGAIVLHPEVYYTDTSGPGQAGVGPDYSIEDNGADDPNPGWYSEMSIVHLFYDLWDDDGLEAFDQVSLPLGTLHDVMVGEQRTTPAFTTLFSFVDGLIPRLTQAQLTAMDDLMLDLGIVGFRVQGPFGEGETNGGAYPDIFLPVYWRLEINAGYFELTFGSDEEYTNSLFANRLAYFYGDGSTVTITLWSDALVGMTLYASGVPLGAADNETAVDGIAELTGVTQDGVLYTLVVTGADFSDPPVGYPATLEVTSP